MVLTQAVLQIVMSQCRLTTKYQSQTKDIIQPNMYTILPNVNQVICTLDTNCMPNIIILAQVVLQLLQSQGPLWVKCLSLKRDMTQSNIHKIFRKVNQVIYIMDPNCMPNARILAQAFLQIFMSQGCFTIRNAKVGQGT